MLKRSFDILMTILLIVVLSPVILTVVLSVRVAMGSPVLFHQKRPGLHGRPFKFLKFRTMTETRDATGELLSDLQRLPRFGAWLRRSSLDELPQLINVLRGDMSLVGPRPLLMKYLPLYSSEQARRHQVRPGITGWAQVHGRNSVEWAEKLSMDVWYVENCSFWLDCQVLWRTMATVVRSRGTSYAGHVTMPEFKGNQDSRDG
jgi:sugar transferase EpsL